MHPLPKGTNPRHVPGLHHRERGSAKWRYSYDDIAAATGLRKSTVKTYASRGKFDPADLASVARFIVSRGRHGSAPSRGNCSSSADGVSC